MAGDPNRKRRRKKALAESGTGVPDPVLDAEVRGMTDDELLRQHREGQDAAERAEVEAKRDQDLRARSPMERELIKALRNMTDEQLLAEHEAAQAELHAAAEEQERRRSRSRQEPAPVVIAAPPEEIHAVEVPEPTPAAPKVVETPRQKWDREQRETIAEVVAEAKEDGERAARRAHELGQRAPSETMGAGELVDLLHREQGR